MQLIWWIMLRCFPCRKSRTAWNSIALIWTARCRLQTKGMTLPFISYGGSSIIATAVGMGMLLAITRKNVHAEDKDDV